MKISELIRQNKDNFIQVKGHLDDGVENDGKRRVCLLGMLGWVLFPESILNYTNQIVEDKDGEQVAIGENSYGMQYLIFEKLGINVNQVRACLGYDIIYANDIAQLDFNQFIEKFEACGL